MRGSRIFLPAIVAFTILCACVGPSEWTMVVPTPAPSPLPFDIGDGRDGPLDLAAGAYVSNDCRSLLSGTGATLTLLDAFGIPEGAVVLVLQTQDQTDGDIGEQAPMVADLNEAGLWELARVTTPGLSTLVLESALTNAYVTVDGMQEHAQVCVIPQYTDVTLRAGAVLRAEPWNGEAGGVAALFVSGTLTLESGARLSASGGGFRGGLQTGSQPLSSCDASAMDGSGGGKGEDVDYFSYFFFGRGNYANGGGGGNPLEAGGGGGGNGGSGGSGGWQNTALCGPSPLGSPGLGGRRIVASAATRLLFGGGGGAGNSQYLLSARDATDGGAGGGAVLVHARAIAGTGIIEADGTYPGLTGGGDLYGDGSAGGGGAGGTLQIRAGASAFTGRLSAAGGRGGDVVDPCDSGPGGGGGGGRIATNGTLGTGATLDVSGGENGVLVCVTDGTQAFGAVPGESGVIEP